MWIKKAFETNVLKGQELSALISNVSVLFKWLYESIKYLNHYCLFGNFMQTKGEFYEISKNTCFYRTPPVDASYT